MAKPAWTWADYEREKRKAQRCRRAKPDTTKAVVPAKPLPSLAELKRRERAALEGAKIDISGAPSAMELRAESWKGKR